jgi:hypothetical protein
MKDNRKEKKTKKNERMLLGLNPNLLIHLPTPCPLRQADAREAFALHAALSY